MPDPASVTGRRALEKPNNLQSGNALWQQRRHLLDTSSLTKAEIDSLIATARMCKRLHNVRSAPLTVLANKIIANVFYENSTRTRSSFELAARRLGATLINLDVGTSSVAKGETIQDTAATLVAMGVDLIVQRHSASGSAHTLAQCLGDRVHVVNAGDGWNEHPTQALLDLFTMLEVRTELKDCKIAIVGDIKHSRVARSNIWLLQKMGLDIHLCGPPTLVPPQFTTMGITVHTKLSDAIKGADFIMALRLQLERQQQGLIPSVSEYKKLYRLSHTHILAASPSVRVLHPGPVNKGIEITGELAEDQKHSLISTQVTNGVAVRMAVLHLLLSEDNEQFSGNESD